jgi:hypothetical protein
MERFQDKNPLPDIISKVHLNELKVITSVLRQLLHREPIEDDFKRVARNFINYNDNHYSLTVDEVEVGTIKIETEGHLCHPHDYFPPTFSVKFFPNKTFAKE